MSSSMYDFVQNHPDVTLAIKAGDLLSFGRRLIAEQKEAYAEESKDQEVFLTAEQVIEMTHVSESTLRRWRVGKILCPVWIAGLRRYRKQDVLALVTEDSDTTAE